MSLSVTVVYSFSFSLSLLNLCVVIFDSFLSLEILLGIFLLRSWAKRGVLSLYMGVCSLVDQNLRGPVVVSLSTQSPMSYSLPPMQLQRPLTSPRVC